MVTLECRMLMPPEITRYFEWLTPIMKVVMPLIALGGLLSIGKAFVEMLFKRWRDFRAQISSK